jgi:hypothetical protein
MKFLLATIIVLAAWVSSCNDGAEVIGVPKEGASDGKGKSVKKGGSGNDEDGVEIDDTESVINMAGFDRPGGVVAFEESFEETNRREVSEPPIHRTYVNIGSY